MGTERFYIPYLKKPNVIFLGFKYMKQKYTQKTRKLKIIYVTKRAY